MMASLGARCGGDCSVRRHVGAVPLRKTAARPSTLSITNLHSKSQELNSALSISRSGGGESRAITGEKLDDWMRDSVVEIVKNLREAPLFVHVYPKSPGRGGEVELRTEKAVAAEDWKGARAKWEKGEAPLPEGVIFVEQLEEDDENMEGEDGCVDREWGIVVQGRGSECGGSACYLLKTSRVGSGFGLCTTHFCLVRVKSFREKAKSQLKNCWLLQSQ